MPPGMGYGPALRGPQQQQQAPMPMQDLDMANAGQAPMGPSGADPAMVEQALAQLPTNKREELANQLAGKTPEERAAFLENWFADWTQKMNFAQGDMDRADALRTDQPGMVGDPNGYRMAASPMAHIGAGMQNYQAQKQYTAGRDARSKALEGAQDARTQYSNILSGG